MKVGFTAHSITRLRQIHALISADSPENAAVLVERIIQRAESLAHFPTRGRTVPEFARDDVREVFESPYRIIYRITADEVQVLTVMHERQLLPGDLVSSR